MNYRIMIVIPLDNAKALEYEFKKVELISMHYLKVRGYHGNPNFYVNDWSDELAKFEINVSEHKLTEAKAAIKKACQHNSEDDGIYSISVLEEVGAISDM